MWCSRRGRQQAPIADAQLWLVSYILTARRMFRSRRPLNSVQANCDVIRVLSIDLQLRG